MEALTKHDNEIGEFLTTFWNSLTQDERKLGLKMGGIGLLVLIGGTLISKL